MKKKSKNTEIEEVAVDLVNPLEIPATPEDTPEAWDSEKDEQLMVGQRESAPIERSDLITPKLHLVQKSGDLSVQFTQGSWVLNKEIQLTEKVGEELAVIVLERPFKFFMEHLPFDPQGPRPRFFNTIKELEKEGLSLEWGKNNTRATADRAARVLILISKPERLDANQGFSMKIEGLGQCALASWLLVNTAYRSVARRLFTAEKLDLEGKPFYTKTWKLISVATTSGGFNFFAPQLISGPYLTDEIAEAIKAKFGVDQDPKKTD